MKMSKAGALKLLAVILALVMWFYVSLSSEVEAQKTFEVKLTPPQGMALSYQSTAKVAITLKGPRQDLKKYYEELTQIKHSIKSMSPEGVTTLSVTDLKLPFGIRAIKIEPQDVQYHLDKKITKILPIKIQTEGEVPPDHQMEHYSIEPREVEVTGAANMMKDILEIKTEKVWLNELAGSGKKSIKLELPHEAIMFKQKTVELEYKLHPTRANMILKNIPITFVTSRLVLKADHRSVNVMVLRENGAEGDLKKNDIKVFAKISETGSNLQDIILTAELPTGIYLKEIQPKNIKVRLENRTRNE